MCFPQFIFQVRKKCENLIFHFDLLGITKDNEFCMLFHLYPLTLCKKTGDNMHTV